MINTGLQEPALYSVLLGLQSNKHCRQKLERSSSTGVLYVDEWRLK